MNFLFKCGSTSLDFIGTLQARRETSPTELLLSSGDLAGWLRESGVVDAELEIRESDLEDALALRSAIAEIVDAHVASDPLPAGALAAVNSAARNPDPVPRLTAAGRQLDATPEQALSSLARDAIEILSGPEAGLIRECSRPGCNQVYVDRSRGARRAWCSMDPCGNRVKARDYRARKAAAAS